MKDILTFINEAQSNNKEIISEILKVILYYGEDMPKKITRNWIKQNFDAEFAKEIWDLVSNWVNDNNVENVEFTLDKESLSDMVDDWKSIKNITKYKINFVKNYSAIMKAADEAFKGNENGPGWNGHNRDDNRWNDNYLFTGSDGTIYVLVKKI